MHWRFYTKIIIFNLVEAVNTTRKSFDPHQVQKVNFEWGEDIFSWNNIWKKTKQMVSLEKVWPVNHGEWGPPLACAVVWVAPALCSGVCVNCKISPASQVLCGWTALSPVWARPGPAISNTTIQSSDIKQPGTKAVLNKDSFIESVLLVFNMQRLQ